MSEVIRKIDFAPKIRKEEFPNIVIADVNETTPLVVQLLEEGDVPVIGVVGHSRKIIARISKSAYNIDRIMRTHQDVTLNQGVSDRVRIYSVREYLEVMRWI